MVINNSDEFSWTGTVTDSLLGPLTPEPITIAPGQSETLAISGVIEGTVENTVTAEGTLDDPDATAVVESVDATVSGEDCSITVTKTVRDVHEARRLMNRIEDAKTERLLMGIEHGKD